VFKNVAFVVCPSQELERPPAAAAALAGVMEANSVDYKIYDLNLDLYKALDNDQWIICERRWRIDPKIDLPDQFDQWLQTKIQAILGSRHDLIAVSVFTKFSARFAEILLTHLRDRCETTIIVGGQGLRTPWGNTTFGESLKSRNLIDHMAIGDGEVIFDRFLRGDRDIPGLDGRPPEQIDDLDAVPYPSLAQLDPNEYFYHSEPGVYVTASRGCVRKCKFCDVPWRWPKYKYRRGEDIAAEMYSQYQKTGVSVFQFTDSVIDGVIPQFESLQDHLIQYQAQDPDFHPKWLSQFNIRRRRDLPERIYQKMARAGASVLICGVEHASWHIRESMGKEFNDDDLDYHIRMCAKYGLRNVFLMFIGYPTETSEDHRYLLQWLETNRRYMLCGTIMQIRWGYTGSLDHGSRLSMNLEEMNIVPEWPDLKIEQNLSHEQDWLYGRNWINTNNPSLTFRERVRRRIEAHERSVELEYPVTMAREELEALIMVCRVYLQQRCDVDLFEAPGDH
jgi:hypothetical protein